MGTETTDPPAVAFETPMRFEIESDLRGIGAVAPAALGARRSAGRLVRRRSRSGALHRIITEETDEDLF
jgi:hypothetical protein